MDKQDIKILFLILFSILLFFWIATWCVYKYSVEISEANIVEVYDGQTKIYQGKQAFIWVTSGGMTTHVNIYSNLYPPIVEKTYSSNEIKIIPHKE